MIMSDVPSVEERRSNYFETVWIVPFETVLYLYFIFEVLTSSSFWALMTSVGGMLNFSWWATLWGHRWCILALSR